MKKDTFITVNEVNGKVQKVINREAVVKNGTPTDLSLVISGASETQDSNTDDYVYFGKGDTVSLEVDPTSSPAGIQAIWGVALRTDIPFVHSLGMVGMGI